MKTTLDLAADLLVEAKTLAARRRTTLKALVEHALRREIHPGTSTHGTADDFMELGPSGVPRLKKRHAVVTSKKIHQLMDEEGI